MVPVSATQSEDSHLSSTTAARDRLPCWLCVASALQIEVILTIDHWLRLSEVPANTVLKRYASNDVAGSQLRLLQRLPVYLSMIRIQMGLFLHGSKQGENFDEQDRTKRLTLSVPEWESRAHYKRSQDSEASFLAKHYSCADTVCVWKIARWSAISEFLANEYPECCEVTRTNCRD